MHNDDEKPIPEDNEDIVNNDHADADEDTLDDIRARSEDLRKRHAATSAKMDQLNVEIHKKLDQGEQKAGDNAKKK